MKPTYKIRITNRGRDCFATLLVEKQWCIFWYWSEVVVFSGTFLMVCHRAGVWQKEFGISDDMIEDRTKGYSE
jgi:hypothetical protein